jgi:dihydroxyacid dehydratase/phosphogluconate dehydratase
MKSDLAKSGLERAPHRSLLYALGLSSADMGKPFIGIRLSRGTFICARLPRRLKLGCIAVVVFPSRLTPLASAMVLP